MSRILQRIRNIAYYRSRLAWIFAKKAMQSFDGATQGRKFQETGPTDLDPRIHLPAYKSMDEFIDLEHLKSLDGFLTERVARFLSESRTVAFHTGKFKRNFLSRGITGSRLITLSQTKEPSSYFRLDEPGHWEASEHSKEFEPLMEFIRTLPFESTGRMVIMADSKGRAITAHRDHNLLHVCHEFLWFRTNLNKPFYLQNVLSGEKKHVRSHSAWFDTVNQYHGGEATGKLSISIRVDGKFTDEFRALMPDPGSNQASRASLWASLESAQLASGPEV